MKLTIESLLVKQVIADAIASQTVDMERCQQVVDALTADMPTVHAETVEQADEVVKQVMDWQRSLTDKRLEDNIVSGRELVVVIGMLLTKLDGLNAETEQMLFDLGVVERGETDT